MKIKSRYIIVTVLNIIVASIFLLLSSEKEKPSHQTSFNEQILQSERFHVNSISTNFNTSASGTVFIMGDEEVPEKLQIVASIEIDSNDWGGVAFYIPKNWYVSNIKSSYPENNNKTNLSDYVSTWITADTETEWSGWIEVGRGRKGHIPTGGGKGTIVIDLISDNNVQQLDPIYLMIEVGSDEKEGIRIIGTDFIKIPITIPDNV